jgi:hypothetical protein
MGMNTSAAWTASLTHEHLRRMDGKLDRLLDDVHELKVRMTGLEENYAVVSRRIDRIERDVERIKKRLGPRGGLRPVERSSGKANLCSLYDEHRKHLNTLAISESSQTRNVNFPVDS